MTIKSLIGIPGAPGSVGIDDSDSGGAGLAAHAAAASGVHGIVAIGILVWGGAAFTWAVNHGFVAVGGVGEPAHNGVGDWSVSVAAPVANMIAVGFTLGIPGWGAQNGAFAGATFNLLVTQLQNTPSNPAGWNAGSLLDVPVPTDGPGVLIIVYGL